MFQKRLTPFLVAVILLFFSFLPVEHTSGQIPSPRAYKGEMQLPALTQPGETTPGNPPVGPGAQFIATSAQRIDRDRAEVRVYRNGQPVELFPSFHELLAATPADRQMRLDRLVGKSVALVPSDKQADQWDIFTGVGGIAGMRRRVARLKADQWDIFTGVGGVGDLVLAGNIFQVRQVLLSSRKNSIEVRVDGEIHRLKPGQALLVL
jgi:hypothetical protein